MSLSKAVVGFVNHKLAEGLTDRSVNSYERLLNKWIEYEGDREKMNELGLDTGI
jgi:hypothetical protein